jgi:hypothetical protein
MIGKNSQQPADGQSAGNVSIDLAAAGDDAVLLVSAADTTV